MSDTSLGLLCAVRQFAELAVRWHRVAPGTAPVDVSVGAQALHLHALNFGLWHHEDAARRPGAADHEVASRKRAIDDLNARRNGAIEDIDANLLQSLPSNPVAPLHSETPGTMVDRLSILALRIAHTADEEPSSRRAVLQEQYDDLSQALDHLLARLRAGQARFKMYRQFKAADQRSHCALFDDHE